MSSYVTVTYAFNLVTISVVFFPAYVNSNYNTQELKFNIEIHPSAMQIHMDFLAYVSK